MRNFINKATFLKHIVLVFFSVSMFFTVFPQSIFATTYGEGTYGSGKYGKGEMTTSQTGSPTCTDAQPGSAPWLYGAAAKSASSILLQFTQALDPVSEYVIEYGIEPGNYQFGMGNIGGKETTSYLVQSLSPNTTYYFRVRAGNGCATGSWSNEISAKTLFRYSSLTGSTDLETEIVETQMTKRPVVQCEPYTVKSGDSLLSIAERLLGSSDRYTEIVELNKSEYPTLETNPRNLSVGWELKMPCEGEKPSETSEDSAQPDVLTVDVKIKVINEQKTPVGGASVTLHSTPREAVTDDSGAALFEDVEVGEHTAIIAYKGQTGEQKINVQAEGDIEEISFTIQIKSTSPFLEPSVLVVIGGLSLALLSALAMLARNRLKRG